MNLEILDKVKAALSSKALQTQLDRREEAKKAIAKAQKDLEDAEIEIKSILPPELVALVIPQEPKPAKTKGGNKGGTTKEPPTFPTLEKIKEYLKGAKDHKTTVRKANWDMEHVKQLVEKNSKVLAGEKNKAHYYVWLLK